MFKKSNKNVEPSVEISIQAIEEDMLTFSHSNLQNISSKERMIEDIKCEATNDLDTSLWFNFFNVFQSQHKDLKDNLSKMQEHRSDLESKRDELESQQLLLKNDIETCLKDVRKAKSPN